MGQFIYRYRYALLNAFKTMLAALLGYGVGLVLASWMHLYEMYTWIVVTILVVMSSQPNIGGAFNKAWMRMLGTAISGGIACLLILIFSGVAGHQFLYVGFAAILIFIGAFFAIALPKYVYFGTLMTVTAAIILFSKNVILYYAMARILEVFVGIIIALLMNRYFFPIKASVRIYDAFSEMLTLLQVFQIESLKQRVNLALTTKIIQCLDQQLAFTKETYYEVSPALQDEFLKTSRLLRRLYRYCCVMQDYIDYYPEKRIKFNSSPEFLKVHQTIIEYLEVFALCFKSRDFTRIFHEVNRCEF